MTGTTVVESGPTSFSYRIYRYPQNPVQLYTVSKRAQSCDNYIICTICIH